MALGPFEIAVEQIEALGLRFTPFVNRLLAIEWRAAGLGGATLTISSQENVADGGVDAATRDAVAAGWIPAGSTAWQFKRTNLDPKECERELRRATWAHEFLRQGGSYVLVLGKGLTDERIVARREKLVAVAIELGLLSLDDPNRIRVYDGNRLAQWASEHPSLVISGLAGGPGNVAIDHVEWSNRLVHRGIWTPDPKRATAIASLIATIKTVGVVDIRVQGESGVGKTRLVLEALRDPELSPLVAYVDTPTDVSGELLRHLLNEGRSVVLVIDDCPADAHAKLTERLPSGTSSKLITIGQSGPATTPTPIVDVEPMTPTDVENYLKANFASLSPEARRFIAAHSKGNLRWTIVLAQRVPETAQAAELITRNDINAFIEAVLPEGRDFLSSTALALLDRVGWDGELRYQLETLAAFVGRPIEEMEAVGEELERRGLLSRHGRYRAVEPHPLAVFLAAEAWRSQAGRIVGDLLPKLDEETALSLFQRVADLGRFEPAQSVLPALLGDAGPFASLETIERLGVGRLLTQLAIVLPEQVTLHLSEQIESESLDRLRGYSRLRRDLVWTLEKLAWHRATFESSANSLLRLALAETESYANNATGTWVALFGTMLPGTAATPSQRADYLRAVATSGESDVRLLAIKAAAHALIRLEGITVSAELQGGVLVEPRGTPASLGDAYAYHLAALEVIEALSRDNESSVARGAEGALIGSLRTVLGEPQAGPRLVDILAGLHGDSLGGVRAEVDRLLRIYSRARPDDTAMVERLQSVLDRLPRANRMDRVRVLAGTQRWDSEEGTLQAELDELIANLDSPEMDALLQLLTGEVPAAWEIGHAVAGRRDSESHLKGLLTVFRVNPAALPGFLTRRVEAGNKDAFDEFQDGDVADALDAGGRVFVAVRGPATQRAKDRIFNELVGIPVANGAFLVFGWHRNLTTQDVAKLLDLWIPRIATQSDYNAAIDWLNLALHGKEGVPRALRSRALKLLLLRTQYRELAQQQWDWARLAENFIDSNAPALAKIILDGIDPGGAMIHETDEDARVLTECARHAPAPVWLEVANRLQAGSWRIQMEVGEWLLEAIPSEVVSAWIGDDVNRARIVAPIAPVKGSSPPPLTRYLLEHFSNDSKVTAALLGTYMAGVWMGDESAHLAGQIEELNGWRKDSALALPIRRWASDAIDYLGQRMATAKEREAEERL
jgi:hypothetical protein